LPGAVAKKHHRFYVLLILGVRAAIVIGVAVITRCKISQSVRRSSVNAMSGHCEHIEGT
jgi:hypothetical protein